MAAIEPTEDPGNGSGGQGQQVRGLAEGPCSLCRQTIAENMLSCPDCGHERQFDQNQYDMLIRCAKGGDASEWHEWRQGQPDKGVRLEAADLKGAWLAAADLKNAMLRGAHLGGSRLWRARLQGADLRGAHLEGADLRKARADGANLSRAILRGADLTGASLEGANLWRARLEEAHLEQISLCDADLRRAHLGRARMHEARLAGAKLVGADLHSADMRRADLSGADISNADIRGVILREANLNGLVAEAAAVDGGTMIWGCDVDVRTDFTGVGLDSARIDPALRSHLEYNIRRKGWGKWYRRHRLLFPVAWPFWQMTDYGRSSMRIAVTFLLLSLAFALVYYCCGLVADQSVVTDLFEIDGQPLPHLLVPVRAVYFSLVTMTTLGLGDVCASPTSLAGHLLVMSQVVLGYVLLGALITRLAIMFQGCEVPWEKRTVGTVGTGEEGPDGQSRGTSTA